MIDNCTRECLGLVANTSLSGRRVARDLDAIILRCGQPERTISDNGADPTDGVAANIRPTPFRPGLTTPAWAGEYIAPGKCPIELVNGDEPYGPPGA